MKPESTQEQENAQNSQKKCLGKTTDPARQAHRFTQSSAGDGGNPRGAVKVQGGNKEWWKPFPRKAWIPRLRLETAPASSHHPGKSPPSFPAPNTTLSCITCGSGAHQTCSPQAVLAHGSSQAPAPLPPRPGPACWGTASSRVSCHKAKEATRLVWEAFSHPSCSENYSGHPGADKGSTKHHQASTTSKGPRRCDSSSTWDMH